MIACKELQVHRHTLGVAKLLACALTLFGLADTVRAIPFEGLQALLAAGLLSVLLALGVSDAAVNDLLPDGYTAPRAYRYKYLVFLGMGASQTPWLYQASLLGALDTAFACYALAALACAGAAILDFRVLYCRATSKHEQNSDPASAPS